MDNIKKFLRWQAKRFVINGQCTLCFEPTVTEKHACPRCKRFEYCSRECLSEDEDSHFEYCRGFFGPRRTPVKEYGFNRRIPTYGSPPSSPESSITSFLSSSSSDTEGVNGRDSDASIPPVPLRRPWFQRPIHLRAMRYIRRRPRPRPRAERAVHPEDMEPILRAKRRLVF